MCDVHDGVTRLTRAAPSLLGEPLEDTVSPTRRLAGLVLDVTVLMVPHGGQHTARRNAWAGMSTDATGGRERREVEAALQRTQPHPPEYWGHTAW